MFYSYPFFMCCVIQKRKCYEAMNIKGFNDRDSYRKYKIWVSGEEGIYKYKKRNLCRFLFYLSQANPSPSLSNLEE